MSAYYSENDPFAAAWLRELIKAGLIADGEVDERSIVDVRPDDVRGFTQCHWFAGVGGWSYALRLAGWPDNEPVWTGSCPCQPFSAAGKGRGKEDARHLWPQFRRLIRQCRPTTVFGEQVASKAGRVWLSGVFADLEALAYRAAGADLCAASVGEEAEVEIVDEFTGDVVYQGRGVAGAPHIRQRLFWVADTSRERRQQDAGGTSGDEGPDGRRSEGDHEPSGDGEDVRGLADSDRPRRRARRPSEASDGRDAARLEPSGLCTADWLEDSNGERLERVGLHLQPGQPRSALPETVRGSEADWMADSNRGECDRLTKGQRRVADWPQARRKQGYGESERCGWSDVEWLPCRDGKYRPTQSGLQPLAARLPGGVVPSGDPSTSESNASTEARVGRLRGYGNSIVAALAAEFIMAYEAVAVDGQEVA